MWGPGSCPVVCGFCASVCLHWAWVVLETLVVKCSVLEVLCFSFSPPSLPCTSLGSLPRISFYFHWVSGLDLGLGTGGIIVGLLIGSPVGVPLPSCARKAPLIMKIGNPWSQKNLVMMSLYQHASSVQTLGVSQCHLRFWLSSINMFYIPLKVTLISKLC